MRIIKDIRLYEATREGKNYPSVTDDFDIPVKVHFVVKRIARKLNELKMSFGKADHIYIYFSSFLKPSEINVTEWFKHDDRIQSIELGIKPESFNDLSDIKKEELITYYVFKILRTLAKDSKLIDDTENALKQFGDSLKIHYKTKKTKTYQVKLFYQIVPIIEKSRNSLGILEFTNLKTNECHKRTFSLRFYDDIYSLVDTISVKVNTITLKPKSSFRAKVINEDYSTPIIFNL